MIWGLEMENVEIEYLISLLSNILPYWIIMQRNQRNISKHLCLRLEWTVPIKIHPPPVENIGQPSTQAVRISNGISLQYDYGYHQYSLCRRLRWYFPQGVYGFQQKQPNFIDVFSKSADRFFFFFMWYHYYCAFTKSQCIA